MDERKPAAGKGALYAGLACLVMGGFLALVAAGKIPAAGEHAPMWVLGTAGGVFVLGGVILLLQAIGGASETTGALPESAPAWMRTAQWLLGLLIWAMMATLGSWIAFGPGPREFSMNLGGVTGSGSDIVGRIAFGVGAVITWLGFAALLAKGLRTPRGA